MARFLPDANVLLHALRAESPAHGVCRAWLESISTRGDELLLAEVTEVALLRIATLPSVNLAPRTVVMDYWTSLLDYPHTRRITAGRRHPELLRRLVQKLDLRGNDLNDGWLAALALEHDAVLVSTDRGFARFPTLTWHDPTGE
jgi:uncharacterized protein